MKLIVKLSIIFLCACFSANAITSPKTNRFFKFVETHADRTAEITGYYESFAGEPLPSNLVLPDYHVPATNQVNYQVIGFYGNGVFRGCSLIKSVAIPQNYKKIPATTFIDCENLQLFSWAIGNPEGRSGDFLIEDGILYSEYWGGWKMFCYPAGKSNTEFQVPTKCTSIGEYCFFGQRHLETIILHEKLTNINTYSFYGCEKLLSLTIPGSVSRIGTSAFEGCSSLKSVSIPASVGQISERAFAKCTNLKTLTIENGVQTIGSEAFADCISLETVIIPASVIQIDNRAFAGCSNLKNIILQSGIKTFGTDVFAECNSLNEVRIVDLSGWCGSDFATPLSNPAYISKRINYVGEIITDLTIPTTATRLGKNAFYGYTPLQSVTIPDNLLSVDKDAFYGCDNLNDVKISDLTSWCNIEFASETSNPLTYAKILSLDDQHIYILNIPEGVEKINKYAFVNGDFNQIWLPSSINQIADAAFKGTHPTSIRCHNTTPPSIVNTAFSDYSATLFVPNEVKSAYWVHNVWGLFSNIKDIPVDAVSISLDKSDIEMSVHDTIGLTVIFNPVETTDKTVFWSSSDESIAKVENGIITALKKGNVTITATTTNNKSASCRVSIKDVIAESITIDPTELILRPGASAKLIIRISPDNTTNQSINWISDNENVVTISQEGSVKAVSEGSARITATTLDGSNLSTTCQVTVSPLKVSSISLNPSSAEGKEGEQIQIKATVLPEGATNKVLAWSSSDESVASVDDNGLVSLLNEGTAMITASSIDGSDIVATCNISVIKRDVLVSSISLDPSYAEGKEGEQIQIKATVLPEDATNKTIEWNSSDERIATVDGSGLISVLKKGTAIITASATDGSGVSTECIVVVTEYSGIEDIMTDKNTYVKVFNLSGVLVYEGIYSDANLVPDYYIVVCDGKNVKVKVE